LLAAAYRRRWQSLYPASANDWVMLARTYVVRIKKLARAEVSCGFRTRRLELRPGGGLIPACRRSKPLRCLRNGNGPAAFQALPVRKTDRKFNPDRQGGMVTQIASPPGHGLSPCSPASS
jgi:hypothetical protein